MFSPFFGGLLRGSFVVTSICTGMIVTLKLVGVLLVSDAYVDPFAIYDSLLPGMPMSALASFPCNYQTNGATQQLTPQRLSCAMFIQDVLLDRVQVEVNAGYITAVNFYAKNVQLGQIALHWQPTQPMQFGSGMTKWEAGNYTVMVTGNALRYENKASHIQITGNPG